MFVHGAQDMIFHGTNKDILLQLRVDVYAAVTGIMIGRASIHPRQFTHYTGIITGAVLDTQLEEVGSISIEYILINALQDSEVHSNLFLKNSSMDPWQSTVVVGHRGSGSKTGSKVGAHHRTHVQENTILSFVSASYDVNFIEFDVQLTSDRIPVIYHDFKIRTQEGWKLPIGLLSLEQFKAHRKQSPAPSPKSGLSPQSVSNKLKRSNSWTQLESRVSLGELKNIRPEKDQIISDTQLPTLEECFKQVPISTGFNIEIKFSPTDPFDANLFVDTVLETVSKFAHNRTVIFSSFHPHICILLKLKQQRYPVFSLNHAGTPRDSQYPVGNSLSSVLFAKFSCKLEFFENSLSFCL